MSEETEKKEEIIAEQPGEEADSDKKETEKNVKHDFAQTLVDIVSIISTSIITIMLIFTFVFRLVGVIGPSMQQTLHEGDWLLVSAFTTAERGDIVIITQPNSFDNEPIVKRVIAVGGDKLEIDFVTGSVLVNDEVIDEPYINTPTTTDEYAWKYPIVIPEGKVFVMGDNRQHSTDSRSDMVGLIDENYILGQVRVRFSPITAFRIFGDYDYE